MSALVASDVAAVQEAVREGGRLLPVAGGTHGATLPVSGGPVRALDVSGLSGIVDYDPAELTFTARPGTTLAEIDAMLAANGQALPFDPPRLGEGATLGGAVAAGVTGPGGFGAGVRDFVVGVRFVDGTGRLAAGGGRVVKNAAGFDLPKLMVGSLGRLGVMVELSLKVFPRPTATATVRFQTASLADGLAAVATLARGPQPLSALDLAPDGTITTRLPGVDGPKSARIERFSAHQHRRVGRLAGALEPAGAEVGDEGAYWEEARRFGWVDDGARVVVVPLAPRQVLALDADLERHGAGRRYGLGANVAWVGWPDGASLDDLSGLLAGHGLSGLTLNGSPLEQPLLGAATGGAFGRRIAAGIDPAGVFGGPR